MTDEQTIALIRTALAAGCGLVIQFLFRLILDKQKQDGTAQEASPRTKRLVAIGLCILVPTLGYFLLVFGIPEPYSLFQHVAYIGAAFVAGQSLHALNLPTGADVRNQENFGEQ